MFDKLRQKLDEKLPFPALRHWFLGRPILAGGFCIVGGVVIILVPIAPLPIMLEIGWAALFGVGLGLILIIGGLFMWLVPENRIFVSMVTAVASLVSLPAANLGGFIIGMMAGIIGSCMAFAWTPDKPIKVKPPSKRQQRKLAKQQQKQQAQTAGQNRPSVNVR